MWLKEWWEIILLVPTSADWPLWDKTVKKAEHWRRITKKTLLNVLLIIKNIFKIINPLSKDVKQQDGITKRNKTYLIERCAEKLDWRKQRVAEISKTHKNVWIRYEAHEYVPQ